MTRSPLVPVVAPVAALIASLVRWWLQGSNNVYTATGKRFYVPDPDLGWRVSPEHPIWLGLDTCAVIAAAAALVLAGGLIIRRREAKRGTRATPLRAIAWLIGAASLAVPIAAVASGSRPPGARDILPMEFATTTATTEIAARLDAHAGRYDIVAHEGTAVTARLTAGGEAFDARFSDITGFWQGDPHDLTQPMSSEIGVAAASVDTGVRARSKHARTGYLHADTYPRIAVRLDRIVAAQPAGAGVAFRAQGTLSLIGRTHAIDITGTLQRPDAAALARLGLTGSILLVQAHFAVAISQTALADKAGDFDGDAIPINVALVLRHAGG